MSIYYGVHYIGVQFMEYIMNENILWSTLATLGLNDQFK